jgi:hypothetical protein
MARIRTIKPEFFTSLTIADLPLTTRLTFIGIWTHVDDEGRCVDDARLIKAAVWPLDDVTSGDVETDLKRLSESSLIARYKVGDRSYLEVTGWREHQKINRPTPSKHPSIEFATEIFGIPARQHTAETVTSGNEESGNGHEEVREDSVRTHGDLTGGKEQGTGNREQGKEGAPQAARESSPPSMPAPERKPKPGSDDDPDWVKFWSIYPMKKSKDGARKSWASAIKKAAAAEIIAGAERYRDDPRRNPEFTKHPTTWLNQGCWTDEPTPAARSTGATSDSRTVSTAESLNAWTKKGTS